MHGLNSGASRAWRHVNGKIWIAEPAFLDKISHPVRTMTFGYNANAFSDVVTSRIIDHAGKLLEDLYQERRSCPVGIFNAPFASLQLRRLTEIGSSSYLRGSQCWRTGNQEGMAQA